MSLIAQIAASVSGAIAYQLVSYTVYAAMMTATSVTRLVLTLV